MPEVTELVTKFSFKGSTQPLDNFNSKMSGAINVLGKVAAGVGVAIGLINTFAIATLRNADTLSQLSKETGISIDRLQTLEGVSRQLGIPFESVATSIGNLTTKIGEASQKGSEEFSRLGISVRDSAGNIKSSTQIMDEMRFAFDRLNLSFAERKSFAEALGLDGQSLQLLQLSQKEFARLTSEADKFGKLTEEQQGQIRLFNAEYGNLSFGISQIGKQIALQFAPDLTLLIGKFSDLIAGSKDFLIDGAQSLIRGFKIIGSSVERLLPIIAPVIGLFAAWKLATVGLNLALAVLASPILLTIAGIAAILLIVDDLIVAMNGGKSVIADFFQEFFDIDVQQVLKRFGEVATRVKELLLDIIPQPILDFLENDQKIEAQTGLSLSQLERGDRLGSNFNQSNNININIATDNPQLAGKIVRTELQQQLEISETRARRRNR